MPEGTVRPDDAPRETPAVVVPLWGQVAGAVLLLVFVALTVDAYAGTSVWNRLPSWVVGAQPDAGVVPPRVFYMPGSTASPGQQGIGSEGQDRVLLAGDVVLLGETGHLVRLESSGRAVDLVGTDGASTMVVNLGAWDRTAERLSGVPARFQSGRWVLDDVEVPSIGAALHPAGAPSDDLPEGFRLGPDPEAGRLRRVGDDDRPAWRIRANKKTPALMLETRLPLPTLDGMLVSVRAVVRAEASKDMVLSVEHAVPPSTDAVALSDRRSATEEWTRLTVRRRVVLPTTVDRVSVGLVEVESGDWIEVRDLDIVLGVLP